MVARPLSGYIVDKMGRKGFDICFGIGTVPPLCSGHPGFSFFDLAPGDSGPPVRCLQRVSPFYPLDSCRSPCSPERKGAANATYWTAVDVGVAAGSMFWGFIAADLGYQLMFGLTIIPFAIAIFIYLQIQDRQRCVKAWEQLL